MEEIDKKSYDELQDEVSNDIKSWMREKLDTGAFDGKLQSVCVITNTVTGKINIESCNIVLNSDVRKILREALNAIERQQLINAIMEIIKK